VIVNVDRLTKEVHDWPQYFLQAKLAKGGNAYSSLLIGLSSPFTKFIKKLSLSKEKRFGLSELSLESKILNDTMDTVPLKEQILKSIQDIPVGLQWKMIKMGMQGAVKPEDQVCALHIYVDELDTKMAKPLLMDLYNRWPSADHLFPLHVCMHLILEIDLVLNTKGQKCWQTMGLSEYVE